jgi:hypothetical protein
LSFAGNHSPALCHQVQQIYISENYDPGKGYQADIGILHLRESVDLSQVILPICLPNDYNADVAVIKNGVLGEV